MNEDERACPRCAETIKKAAVVCRFCGLGKPDGEEKRVNIYAKPQNRLSGIWIGWVILAIFLFAIFGNPLFHAAQHVLDQFRPDPKVVSLAQLEKEFDIEGDTVQHNYAGQPLIFVAKAGDYDDWELLLDTIYVVKVRAKMLVRTPVRPGTEVKLHCRSVTARSAIIGYKPYFSGCEIIDP